MKVTHDALLFQRIGLGVLDFLASRREGAAKSRSGKGTRGVPGQVVLVSSARGGEGKSFVAQGLAAVLADQQDGDVLWVDAAFDRELADDSDAQGGSVGLSEVMASGTVVGATSTDLGPDRLWHLGRGANAQPALLSRREAVSQGLVALRSRFALVVIDAPSLGACGELLHQADAPVMVIDSRQTSGREARRALANAKIAPDRLAGIILNHRPRPTPRWLGGD